MRHTLFPMQSHAAAEASEPVAVAERPRATLELLVAQTDGPLEVAVEWSATGDAWATLVTLSSATPGLTSKSSTATPADFTLEKYHRFLRARLATFTGSPIFEVTYAARFFEPTVDDTHKALLTKEARSFSDLARIASEAEDDVLGLLLTRGFKYPVGGYGFWPVRPELVETIRPEDAEALAATPDTPILDIELALPGVNAAFVAEIATQTEHRWRRYTLAQRAEPTDLVTLRNMGELAPNLGERLARYRRTTSTVWRGR